MHRRLLFGGVDDSHISWEISEDLLGRDAIHSFIHHICTTYCSIASVSGYHYPAS